MFNKTSKPQNRIDSLIGATTRIEGNVIFSGGLRVDGMVRGNVAALSVKTSGAGISVTAFIAVPLRYPPEASLSSTPFISAA